MAPPIRDLTGNRSASSSLDSSSLTNPFTSRDNIIPAEDNNQYHDADDDQDTTDDTNRDYEMRNFENTGISPADSSSLDMASKNVKPNEYDRYPSYTRSVSSSRQSLIPGGSVTNNNSEQPTPTVAQNPFLTIDPDVSPFGGYPASSFPLHTEEKEADDYLHNPDPIADAEYDNNRFMYDLKHLDRRSAGGIAGFVFLILGAIALFAVFPALTYSGVVVYHKATPETYTVLTEYEYPQLSAARTSLVDPDTPASAMTREARDGSLWSLVFSDEFNAEGRTFYDGDDQFWYAADLNYAATNDLEWYDPDAVTTANGTLQLRMDAIKQHNLFYRSGMVHSWNRMCFTQGIFEVSASFPNKGNVSGLWPGLWSMGNIGRPGYMATTEGTWPYSYDSCDAGITPNQSSPDGISYLPGQKLNACTCSGEDHPNPGTGRGAPEIDIIEVEADTDLKIGVASQSVQIAPMDIWYIPDYNFIEVHNKSVTSMNTYAGGPFQQAISATTVLNTTWYEKTGGRFQKYAYEYLNDDDDGYIRWFVGDDPTFTMHSYALAPNGNVGWRRIAKEPLSMIMNFGVSNNWAYIDWPSLTFPSTMSIDYVRIYQPNDSIAVTCDPDDYPTYDYIQDHLNAYEDYNLTSWEKAGYTFPKHSLDGC